MNKQIQEFMQQAGTDVSGKWMSVDNATKFAELIVRECVDCLKPLSRNHSMVGAAQDTIREHFGVEL